MGTRSSRFFVVLVHLVGVSRFQPSHRTASRLVGGAPHHQDALILYQNNDSYNNTASTADDDDTIISSSDSVWIQDSQSRDCLGPFGWSDCGDATLWTLERVLPRPPYRLRMGLFGVKPAERKRRRRQAGWRLCLVEEHDDDNTRNGVSRRQRRRWQTGQRACLVANAHNQQILVEHRQWKRNHVESLWKVNAETGNLQSLATLSSDDTAAPLCLWRRAARQKQHGTSAELRLESCDSIHLGQQYRKVNVSLIQYQAVTLLPDDAVGLPKATASASIDTAWRPVKAQQYTSHHAHAYPTAAPSLTPRPIPSQAPVLPHHSDQAHRSAIEPHDVLPFLNQNTHGQVHQALLKSSNPILLTSRISRQMMDSNKKNNNLHKLPQPSPAGLKARNKIAVHPYLQAAQNGIWKDPSTGLEYATDLTTALNRSRREHGRHSLMGVGQYIKGFVIKVYGVAFYISKRDALADLALVPFAGLSSDELRQRPDFYQVLRTMGTTFSNFERTIVLKTNMQLSADTMRSSLHADWSQLTSEMKDTLLNSSMEPRPADSAMLDLIQSPDNPSRCSCSSVAPPEYSADPNCCARGTELAFTWLKSGDLEVRMNGQIMDTFASKEMAEGIFFEYLRMDDPISPDFLNRVVDGFPFLLAPLAQVKGLHLGQGQGFSKGHENPVTRALFSMLDTIHSGSSMAAGMLHSTAAPLLAHAGHGVKVVGDTMKATYHELKEHKDALVEQVVSFPDFVMSVISGENGGPILGTVSDWISANTTPSQDDLQVVRRDSPGRAFGYPLSRWFSDAYQAPDEIGPMKVDPTMDMTRRIFLAFVHVYLLLLFIVSFPNSYSSRTRLVVRNNMIRLDRADNGSLSSTDESESDEKEFGSVSEMACDCEEDDGLSQGRTSKRARKLTRSQRVVRNSCDDNFARSRLKKKSLSYFL